ncbi:unnamed protein product, partial [Closterium sp. NIES-54]
RAAGAGGAASTGGAGAGGAAGASTGGSTFTWGAGALGPGGARTGGTGAAGPAGAPGVGAVGVAGVGATGGTGAGAAVSAGGPAGVGATRGTGARAAVSAGGPAGAGAGGVTGTGGAAGVGDDAGGAGGAARPRPYFVPLLEKVLGLRPSSGPALPLECPPPVQSESQLQLASPLPAPSPYAGPTGGLAKRRERESRPASPVRTARTSRRVPRPRPLAVPGTHQMVLRPSTAPQRVPLPSPPASSLPALADPASDSLRAASPTVTRLLATVVTDPSFESTAASALVTELVEFAAHCRLDFATGLVAYTDVLEDRQEEFQCFGAALPHLVSMQLAPEGDPDAPDIPTLRSYAEAIEGPYSSQWQAAMDAEMASWKSTGTYVDEVPPPGANIVSGMRSFRVKRPPGSPPVFKARYVGATCVARHTEDYACGSWVPPSTADPSLFLRTDTSLPPFYILVYVDDLVFATADTAGLAHVKSELQKRHTCSDLGELRSYLGLQITRDRARAHHYLDSVTHGAAALPSDESVEPSGPYPELVGCLMYLMTCTRPDLAYPLSIFARYVAPGRHRPEHMAAAKRVLHYLCSTSGLGLVLGGRSPVVLTGHADASSCEAEIYAGSMAAQELRWLTYLLTDLGEPPRSPPVLYVDNKAMLALCREQRLEHRTNHIALRYFLARELQQCGQLRLAYVASQANTADIFTKALQPCDHQRFYTMLGLVPTWPHLLTS